ncbi:hypothetical protein [Acetobacterium sp.]|uniref:hypothetical protein n=1 Tax=Acetobacterium sp. TaxID=1872094 RepID=UPI00271EBF0C|nr:hypothetical protein [Acetobacterium sp.]MDO9490715.1 hypothetical protein [Acetobacterium sp.]
MAFIKGSLIVLYLACAFAWIFDIWSIRQFLPSYLVWAGAIGIAYLLPRGRIQYEGDPTFGRWFIDNFGFYGPMIGGLLFALSSGLILGNRIEINLLATVGIALAVAGAWSNFIPREWFSAPVRSRKAKD